MAKVVVNPVSNITGNETSAASTLNANDVALQAAIENTLSRDGTSPNTMSADIDLNSNDLLNVSSINATTYLRNGVPFTGDITVDVTLGGVPLTNYSNLVVAGDWTAAFIAATNANDHVILPPGDITLNLTTPILLKRNFTLTGSGRKNVFSSNLSGSSIIITGSGASAFKNLDVTSANNWLRLDGFSIKHTGSHSWLFDLNGSNNFAVLNCDFETTSESTGLIKSTRIVVLGVPDASWVNQFRNCRFAAPITGTVSKNLFDVDFSATVFDGCDFIGGLGFTYRGVGATFIGCRWGNQAATSSVALNLISGFSLTQLAIVSNCWFDAVLKAIVVDCDTNDGTVAASSHVQIVDNHFRCSDILSTGVTPIDITLLNATGIVITSGPIIVGNQFNGVNTTNILYDLTKFTAPIINDNLTLNATALLNIKSGPDIHLATPLVSQVSGQAQYTGNTYVDATQNGSGQRLVAHRIRQVAPYTLTSTTALQKIFNASTNGAFNASIGNYRFRMHLRLTSLSASSGDISLGFAGSATFAPELLVFAKKSTTAADTALLTDLPTIVQTSIVAANTNTAASVFVEGEINVTVAGTIIPQLALGVATTANVVAGSWVEFMQMETNVLGNWT